MMATTVKAQAEAILMLSPKLRSVAAIEPKMMENSSYTAMLVVISKRMRDTYPSQERPLSGKRHLRLHAHGNMYLLALRRAELLLLHLIRTRQTESSLSRWDLRWPREWSS